MNIDDEKKVQLINGEFIDYREIEMKGYHKFRLIVPVAVADRIHFKKSFLFKWKLKETNDNWLIYQKKPTILGYIIKWLKKDI